MYISLSLLVLFRGLKGSVIASLFFVITILPHFAWALEPTGQSPVNPATEQIVADALALKLDQHLEWQALLHVHGETPYIKDRGFLLSLPSFSSAKELTLNISALLSQPQQNPYLCRFPARAMWLQQNLHLAPLSFSHCGEFIDYLNHAPVDQIKLVFVSENITHPTSMMGHVLLDMSGQNQQGRSVDHAISFYTDISGFNAPKIFFQAMVTGKQGYFALTPLQDRIARYLHREQRNIWTFSLILSPEQRQRIQYHVWELKTTPIKYYFSRYNCGTLTHFVLATTGNPAISASFSAIVTPLDIVKSLNAAQMIAGTTLQPSDQYAIRMLSEPYSPAWQANIGDAIAQHRLPALLADTPSTQERFVIDQVAAHQQRFLIDSGKLPAGDRSIDQQRDAAQSLIGDFQIDLSQYKNPLLAPNDSQISVGTGYSLGQHDLRFDYLPAAQKLEDDNSQYISEHELLLGNIGLKYLIDAKRLKLDYIKLYSISSYVPVDHLTGGVSSQFSMVYAPRIDQHLQEQHALTISGGAGYSYQIMPNLQVSALATAGLDYDHGLDIHLAPSLGLIANEKLQMKSILQYQRVYSTQDVNKPYHAVQLLQSKRFNSAYSLQFKYERDWNTQQQRTGYALMFKRIF
jgi:hypothetical protein